MRVRHVVFARGKAILQLPVTRGWLRRGLMECIVIESSLAVALQKKEKELVTAGLCQSSLLSLRWAYFVKSLHVCSNFF